MPLYEYLCEQTGERIELLRSAADADKPVSPADARAAGATREGAFRRVQSTFAAKGTSGGSASLPVGGGCCPCGKTRGGCGGG